MNKGLTLIELLIGIFIFSIVVILVGSIFVQSLRGRDQIKTLAVLHDEARYIMDYMAREIRMAEIVNNGPLQNTLIINPGNISYEFKNQNIERDKKPLNSPNIEVTNNSAFNIEKNPNPSRVEIILELKDKKNGNLLQVQTTISSRYYK